MNPSPDNRPACQAAFAAMRSQSRELCAGLSAEDLALQSMPEASSGKWHLAHTTWFFETLLLQANAPGYWPVAARWAALYRRPALWLSDGWAEVQARRWQAPAYWLPSLSGSSGSREISGVEQFTLQGLQPLDAAAPICHLSGLRLARDGDGSV